jgi:hypothetical protein
MSRPDHGFYLAHFTTNRPPVASKRTDNPTLPFTKGKTALQKLISILELKTIYASYLPWNNRLAVCLTECPWSSLLAHAHHYSPNAIGFNKAFIFAAGGGPVYYVRADHFDKQKWESDVYTFVTPFWPGYRPRKLKGGFKTVDYSHEREWRVPHDLKFEYSHIEFIILKDYKEMAQFPGELKDKIGREKFLLMENYTMIEKLWPVHKI